jgi:hypothetical protein
VGLHAGDSNQTHRKHHDGHHYFYDRKTGLP